MQTLCSNVLYFGTLMDYFFPLLAECFFFLWR